MRMTKKRLTWMYLCQTIKLSMWQFLYHFFTHIRGSITLGNETVTHAEYVISLHFDGTSFSSMTQWPSNENRNYHVYIYVHIYLSICLYGIYIWSYQGSSSWFMGINIWCPFGWKSAIVDCWCWLIINHCETYT